jgi:hypothetical protein
VSGSRGEYFDGQSSLCHQVELTLGPGELILRDATSEKRCPYDQLWLSDALGSVNRAIYFADGGKCEILNDAFATSLQRKLGRGRFFTQVHRFETSLKLAALALLLTAVVVWGFIRFGIPTLAEHVAAAIPAVVEIKMGEEAFVFLDQRFFSESGLSDERKDEISGLFSDLLVGMEEDERNYRLFFRHSEAFGANALALPGGIVIVTDDFIDLVEKDEELIAVLAHEIGHVQCRHALRKLLQDSSAGLLLAALTGDISSTTSIAAALPTMLVDARFSRDMEREADDVAVRYLHSQGISLQYFADVLARLQARVEGSGGSVDGVTLLQYLATHPATEERIERLQGDSK